MERSEKQLVGLPSAECYGTHLSLSLGWARPFDDPGRTANMPATVKEMLSAARAAVPAITPAGAADLVAKAGAVVVDVRDGSEVAASGKVKGALALSRGLLEFRPRHFRQ